MSANTDDALAEQFARNLAKALVAELGREVAIARLSHAVHHADDRMAHLYRGMIAALRSN